MVDSFTLLQAMNGICPEDLLCAGDFLTQAPAPARRLRRTLLLAAVLIALLIGTACAVGFSIHARRQEQLRQDYQVEENRVSSYKEYEVPEAPVPGITLLSAYNNGQVQHVYVNVCPVPPEEVRDPFMQDTAEDGRVHYLEYVSTADGGITHRMADFYLQDREYAPEDYVTVTEPLGYSWQEPSREAKIEKYLTQAYDAESQTLTLHCFFWPKNLPEGATQAQLHILSNDVSGCYDENGFLSLDIRRELRRDFGTITVDIVPPDTRKLMLEEPVVFTNPHDGCSGRVLGFELSSGQITWLLDFEEEVWPYLGSLDAFEEEDEFHSSWMISSGAPAKYTKEYASMKCRLPGITIVKRGSPRSISNNCLGYPAVSFCSEDPILDATQIRVSSLMSPFSHFLSPSSNHSMACFPVMYLSSSAWMSRSTMVWSPLSLFSRMLS